MKLDAMTLIQMGILALVGLVITFAVIRPVLSPKPATDLPALAPPPSPVVGSSTGETIDGDVTYDSSENALVTVPDRAAKPDNSTGEYVGDNPVQRLREMIETRQEETVDILRQWLEQKERQGSNS